MTETIDSQIVDFLSETSGLPHNICRRIALDVLAQYEDTLEEFVQRRHRELKHQRGFTNEVIYPQILSEAANRRFAAPTLSERQIRRIIYG